MISLAKKVYSLILTTMSLLSAEQFYWILLVAMLLILLDFWLSDCHPRLQRPRTEEPEQSGRADMVGLSGHGDLDCLVSNSPANVTPSTTFMITVSLAISAV